MMKLKFWLALWAGKFFLWIYKKTGHTRNDKPGMASMRLCSDFLQYVAKPKLTIVVSGTNGKTTISSIIADVLRAKGMSVSFNDWGANHHAGHARCLLDAVNIFNRSTKDAVVIEMDELISSINVPKLKADYLIISNLSRDSMARNAHPEYIAAQLKKAAQQSPDTVVILNADDPLSCFLGENNTRIYFGVHDLERPSHAYRANDFSVCPRCGAKPIYHYRNYRHIGDFKCPCCGFHSPDRDYFVTAVGDKTMTVRESSGKFTYPVPSTAVHNIYNLAAVVALFRHMGISHEDLSVYLRDVKLPVSRESRETVNGIELITQVAKGQNPTAVSTVFEKVGADTSEMEIILILDEVFKDTKQTESIAWIYDTDYEFLNRPNIHKIIIGGERYLDHRLRFRLAGLPEEKLVYVKNALDTSSYVDFDGISKIYILHDVNSITRGRLIRDAVKERILDEGGAAQ